MKPVDPVLPLDGSVFARRTLLLGAAASLATLACPSVLRAQDETFRFGLTPVFLSNDLELLGKLRQYLATKLDAPVELISRRTYQEITALLVSGQIHSAWICGYPFVQFRSALDLVVTPIWQGKPLYQSYVIAAADREIDDWRQLRGDIHAYSDPDSNSGYLVTQALLIENGLAKKTSFRVISLPMATGTSSAPWREALRSPAASTAMYGTSFADLSRNWWIRLKS